MVRRPSTLTLLSAPLVAWLILGLTGLVGAQTTIKPAVNSSRNAFVHKLPINRTGNATAAFLMNGLGHANSTNPCLITPGATGRVWFLITGQLVQNTTADGVTIKLAEGTGAAPDNAAAASGTVISATQTWTALTGQLTTQFAIQATATALAVGTPVWFDLQVADVTGGTASLTNIDCTAVEI